MSSTTTSTRPRTPRPPGPADPERFARLLLRVWFEVRAGDRPFVQLAPLLAPPLRRRLLSQLPRGTQRRQLHAPVAVRRIVVTSPRDDAYEMSVVLNQGERVTAVALRLERHHAIWRAIDLTAPETGLSPITLPAPRRLPDAFDEVLDEG